MPIDFTEVTNITSELAELMGQITLMQAELRKPIMRIKMLAQKIDAFGDVITIEDKEKHFIKAKADFAKTKTMIEKNIHLWPKVKREQPGQ